MFHHSEQIIRFQATLTQVGCLCHVRISARLAVLSNRLLHDRNVVALVEIGGVAVLFPQLFQCILSTVGLNARMTATNHVTVRSLATRTSSLSLARRLGREIA